jgi:hypothetical protein
LHSSEGSLIGTDPLGATIMRHWPPQSLKLKLNFFELNLNGPTQTFSKFALKWTNVTAAKKKGGKGARE